MIRSPLLLMVMVVAALALAACGTSKDNNSGAKADDDYEMALKFAKCMRDHGVDMSDPTKDANGRITQEVHGHAGNGKGPRLTGNPENDPTLKAAEQACKKYMPKGGGTSASPAEQAKMRDAFLAYARCMRSKGLHVPDPKFTANGVQVMLGRGVRPDAAKFKAADQACHPLLAAIDKGKGAGGSKSSSGGGAQ